MDYSRFDCSIVNGVSSRDNKVDTYILDLNKYTEIVQSIMKRDPP